MTGEGTEFLALTLLKYSTDATAIFPNTAANNVLPLVVGENVFQ